MVLSELKEWAKVKPGRGIQVDKTGTGRRKMRAFKRDQVPLS